MACIFSSNGDLATLSIHGDGEVLACVLSKDGKLVADVCVMCTKWLCLHNVGFSKVSKHVQEYI